MGGRESRGGVSGSMGRGCGRGIGTSGGKCFCNGGVTFVSSISVPGRGTFRRISGEKTVVHLAMDPALSVLIYNSESMVVDCGCNRGSGRRGGTRRLGRGNTRVRVVSTRGFVRLLGRPTKNGWRGNIRYKRLRHPAGLALELALLVAQAEKHYQRYGSTPISVTVPHPKIITNIIVLGNDF